jgi:hypothetical protein
LGCKRLGIARSRAWNWKGGHLGLWKMGPIKTKTRTKTMTMTKTKTKTTGEWNFQS